MYRGFTLCSDPSKLGGAYFQRNPHVMIALSECSQVILFQIQIQVNGFHFSFFSALDDQ